MKFRTKTAFNLWVDSPNSLSQNTQLILNKLHDIEHRISMEETVQAKVERLCSELMDFIGDGYNLSQLKLNTSLFLRLVFTGVDLMGLKQYKRDFLILGAFIDMHIKVKWKQPEFISLINGMLKQIISGSLSFKKEHIQKIICQYHDYNSEDYDYFFS
ncbi:MAG: hypothetical protein ACI9QD_001184 [Thermoproteota archaeon]|jgi:hypothetical protein